ncbi:hypothetical protein SESBI_15622 [Sesbania bispinosa]|nr:hypothetical protein SESBI_15622 [Sesbania bispinosa]
MVPEIQKFLITELNSESDGRWNVNPQSQGQARLLNLTGSDSCMNPNFKEINERKK